MHVLALSARQEEGKKRWGTATKTLGLRKYKYTTINDIHLSETGRDLIMIAIVTAITMPNASNFYRSNGERAQLLLDFAADADALQQLKNCITPTEQQALTSEKLVPLIPKQFRSDIVETRLFRDFLTWCHEPVLRPPSPLTDAVHQRAKLKKALRKDKRDFIDGACLNWSANEKQEYLSTIPRHDVKQPAEPYPPLGHWMYESDHIRDLWEDHIMHGPQPDKRKKRLPMLRFDPSKLSLDIPWHESGLIYVGGTLRAVVLRDFCPSKEACEWVDNTIGETTACRSSIRV
jgi:hypothetical protein